MPKLSMAPAAVTSDGQVVVGIGYVHDVRSLERAVELAKSSQLTGTIFVGVVLKGRRVRAALRRLDDAAAEIAATSGVGRPPLR